MPLNIQAGNLSFIYIYIYESAIEYDKKAAIRIALLDQRKY